MTQAVRELYRLWLEELKDRWASGEFADVGQYEAAIVNAKRIGQCETITRFLEIDYEQLISEIENGK